MTESQDRMAFEQVNIIDGNTGDVVRGTTVLIHNGVIEAILEDAEPRPDLAGYHRIRPTESTWMLPGLVNCHDHLMNKGLRHQPTGTATHSAVRGWRADLFLRSPGFQALESAKNAQQQLRQGVTTIRELSGPAVTDIKEPAYTNVDLRDAIENGLLGPRVLACRLAVAMTGGHGYPWYALRQADGEDEVRKAVREQLRGDADFIKIMASGGFSNFPKESPETVEYSVKELTAAREEAHRAGRLVTAHAIANQGVINAVEAGIDTIEHGFLIEPETVRLMSEQGTSFVPTVSVVVRLSSGRGDLAAYARHAVQHHKAAVNEALELGIDIGVGTDSRATMLEEMENLSKIYGLPVQTVLASATGTAARICGLDDAGVIGVGKRADLIILGRNPHNGIRTAFKDILAVLKDGKVVFSLLPGLRDSHAHHGL